jgi:hypothetical protein
MPGLNTDSDGHNAWTHSSPHHRHGPGPGSARSAPAGGPESRGPPDHSQGERARPAQRPKSQTAAAAAASAAAAGCFRSRRRRRGVARGTRRGRRAGGESGRVDDGDRGAAAAEGLERGLGDAEAVDAVLPPPPPPPKRLKFAGAGR